MLVQLGKWVIGSDEEVDMVPIFPTPHYRMSPSTLPMKRHVQSELLDTLPPGDPRAIRSRRDLRRLNVLMGNVESLASVLRTRFDSRAPGRVADLGAGDGTAMLRLARQLSGRWRNVEVVLVDRQAIVSANTCRRFEALSWTARPVQADVFDWLAEPSSSNVDLMTANLFLHHFDNPTLARLARLAAERTNLFVACEPRRGRVALRASLVLWLIGCNPITRHDAMISVRAGFCGKELSALWPRNGGWRLEENAVGLFSHRLVAQRLTSLLLK